MKIKFIAVFTFFLLFLRFFALIPRVEFWHSIGIYTLLFILFALLNYLSSKFNISLLQILIITLLSRMVFFFTVPLHSDDYFRFFWDGHLVLQQIDPYEYTPSGILESEKLPAFLKPIYNELNSPHYFSVYPLTNQILFTCAAWLGGTSIQGFVDWLRVSLILFELIGVWILFQLLGILKMNKNKVLLYALNPLVLLEITGNLHFEGLMLTFMFLGIWALAQRNYFFAGGWIGMAISVKLTPLILLPLVLKYLNLKNFCFFISAAFLVCVLFFSPLLWWGSIGNFISSLQLYYGKFEFNASLYYLIREVGFMIKGYNIIQSISIVFSLMVLFLICYLAWSVKIVTLQVFIQTAIVAYLIYLILGMVVHPWYVIPLLGLSILGGKVFPLVWSYLIYLSYHAYSVEPYSESFVLLFIQYASLFVIVFVEYYSYLYLRKK